MSKKRDIFPESDAWAAEMAPLSGRFGTAAVKRGPQTPESAAEAEYNKYARMDLGSVM